MDEADEDDVEIPKAKGADAGEEELLEQIPLPGVPDKERARRKAWLQIPRKARVAIRRMHEEWGHMPNSVMVEILKTAKASKEHIKAAQNIKCKSCDDTAGPKQRSKSSPPTMNYTFNHTVGIDVFDLHDHNGDCWLFLDIVDYGTDFQIVCFSAPRDHVSANR